MKTRTRLIVALVASLSVMSSYAAKNADGEKVNLSGIDARLAALESLDAGTRLDALEATSYDGDYTVTVLENQHFGCQPQGTDLLTELGNSNLVGYLLNQERSAVSSRSVTYVANSFGGTLTIPLYDLVRYDIDLSGETFADTKQEGGFAPTINGDGSITFDAGPDVNFSGQFSDDGSMFTFLAQGQFEEGTPGVDLCYDNFMIMGVGVRK